jgi:hypothetical protein
MHKSSLALLFLLGCVTGGVASRVTIPPARAGTNPQRWEYLCAQNPDMKWMNEAGAAGYELVTSAAYSRINNFDDDRTVYCLKRPL